MKRMYLVSLAVSAAAVLAFSSPARASKMDAGIESHARATYVFQTYLKDDAVTIRSKDGAVILTGTVADSSRKALATDTVLSLADVRSVDNRLEIKGAPTASSDARLSDKLKITLLFHRSVSAGKTEVSVKDGIVTLRGNVDSQAQKDLTNEYVRDVEGVKEINNEMTVSAPAAQAPRTAAQKMDDASVTAQVRMALMLHRSTSALNTSVSTKRGVVTIDGKAANAAETGLVTRLVTDVNGVKDVKNRMTIK